MLFVTLITIALAFVASATPIQLQGSQDIHNVTTIHNGTHYAENNNTANHNTTLKIVQGRIRWRAKGGCRTDWRGKDGKCWHQCRAEAKNDGQCPLMKTMWVNFLQTSYCGHPEHNEPGTPRVCECVCKF
ncbi:hypothetical protein E8E11_003340 [Didymella keratinophila]|nr:hypothetical protein E8E11_003340 [Didymella keratinophila]